MTALITLMIMLAAPGIRAREEKRTCPMDREYFVYTPDVMDAGKTFWLVVGVHGYRSNGKGAGRMSGWIDKGNVIVVGPSFPNEGYQGLGKDSDRQLIDIFKLLQKEFRLHPKFFIAGFSGGSQYAHRFALAHPELVIGCAAHSGGTWADQINAKAIKVPFAISCGENDTAKSFPEATFGRIDGFRDFVGRMSRSPFYFKARVWPGVGHQASPGSAQMTEECFNLSTTGMSPEPLGALKAEVQKIEEAMAAGRYGEGIAGIRKLAPLNATPVPLVSNASESNQGNSFPGIKEDANGWRVAPAGKAALEEARLVFLKQTIENLSARMVESAIARINQIAADKPDSAIDQLKVISQECRDIPKVQAAITRVLPGLRGGKATK